MGFGLQTVLSLALGLGTSAASPTLGQAGPTTLEAIDRGFVCPEELKDQDARMASLRAYVAAFASVEPSASPVEMLRFRRSLLERHHCEKTLASVNAASKDVAQGDVRRQAWLSIGSDLRSEQFISLDHLRPRSDPDLPTDFAVEAYSRILFKIPMTAPNGMRYSELVSDEEFLCGAQKYRLRRNYYYLNSRLVDQEPASSGEPVGGMPLRDISGGTYNAAAADWACHVYHGLAS